MDIKYWEQKFLTKNRELYKKAENPLHSHGPDHHLRVWQRCKKWAKKYHADSEVLVAAALFHDISAYYPEIDVDKHQEEAAKIAEEILKKDNYPKVKISKVLEAITQHGSDIENDKRSLESKILCDVDKLEAFGPLGVARIITALTLRGKTLMEIVQDFYYGGHLKKKWKALSLKDSKKTGKKDYRYALKFFSKLAKKLKEKNI